VNQVAAAVDDPQTDVTVGERVRARLAVEGEEEALEREDLRISPLGSGSDYTPFLQHLGLSTLHLGYGGEGEGGSYHSLYDSFDHFTRFLDPGFEYGIALTRTAGRLTLRLAQADVLPHRFSNLADAVSKYLDEVEGLADEMRAETQRHNRLVREEYHLLAADPTHTYVPPEAKAEVPHLNFAPMRNAVARLEEAAAAFDAAVGASLAAGGPGAEARAEVNGILQEFERSLTSEEGLPRRPWFRHQVYAPGFYTGYGVKTLPGIREAIEQRSWEEAAEQVDRTAAALGRAADRIERATALLEG
jgi:N-acetylated-alpha-linked acidic dipeptidase